MPPSFELDDLAQAALIEHWRRVRLYDPSRNDNYRAYASLAIRGAVLMICRRKHYREATHEPLDISPTSGLRGQRAQRASDWTVRYSGRSGEGALDQSPDPEKLLLEREEQRRLDGSTHYLQRLRLLIALARLSAEDANLVRQVLAGADVDELDRATPGVRRRFLTAVRKLKAITAATYGTEGRWCPCDSSQEGLMRRLSGVGRLRGNRPAPGRSWRISYACET